VKKFAAIVVLGGAATVLGYGQAVVYNSLNSSLGNLVTLDGSPTALHRYNNAGFLIGTIASVPNALALTKVLGNYYVTTGLTLVQVTPLGAVTPVATAPSSSQWTALAPDGLGNLLLADNKAHAVWRVNLQTSAASIVGNYPATSAGQNEDVGIIVDPSGNYLILSDNNATLSMFSMTPSGTVVPVTLTGFAATNTNGKLIRYNGVYAFISYGDNAICTITFTVPPGSATAPVATVAELASSITPSGTPRGLTANLDSGALFFATSANTVQTVELKTNGSGVCAPNCSSLTIAYPTQPRDVIEEAYGELPYLAFGSIWTTGVYIFNSADVAASYSVSFYNPDGSVATAPFAGGGTSALKGTLPPRGMTYVEASNPSAGTTSTVSGLISADPSISVQGLFRDTINGTYWEAGVPSSLGGNGFSVPFDFTTFVPTGQQLFTGLAISNFSPSNSATVTCVATNQSGTVIPNALTIPTLLPLGQFSGYSFSPLYGLSGTLTCTSTTRVAAFGVRSLGSTFSLLPVVY